MAKIFKELRSDPRWGQQGWQREFVWKGEEGSSGSSNQERGEYIPLFQPAVGYRISSVTEECACYRFNDTGTVPSTSNSKFQQKESDLSNLGCWSLLNHTTITRRQSQRSNKLPGLSSVTF